MNPDAEQAALKLRNLMVALDVGVNCDGAVARALELAHMFDARVEIVHAIGLPGLRWELVPTPASVASGVDAISVVRGKIVEHVGGLLKRAKHSSERAEELVHVTAGQPANVLLDRARALGADLIVMGALRKRRMLDFGSTARAVLAKAPCAVWVQPDAPAPIRRILVAFDFSSESHRALATAVELASRTGASVRVVHVFDLRPFVMDGGFGIADFESVEEARKRTAADFEQVMAKMEWRKVEHDWVLAEGTPDVQILEQGKTADLVLMGTHGRSGFAAAVLGSVAYSVLKSAAGPVMVVRNLQRQFAHA